MAIAPTGAALWLLHLLAKAADRDPVLQAQAFQDEKEPTNVSMDDFVASVFLAKVAQHATGLGEPQTALQVQILDNHPQDFSGQTTKIAQGITHGARQQSFVVVGDAAVIWIRKLPEVSSRQINIRILPDEFGDNACQDDLVPLRGVGELSIPTTLDDEGHLVSPVLTHTHVEKGLVGKWMCK